MADENDDLDMLLSIMDAQEESQVQENIGENGIETNDNIDPMEAELMEMEKQMKMLREKINKKKRNVNDKDKTSSQNKISKNVVQNVDTVIENSTTISKKYVKPDKISKLPPTEKSEIHQGDTDSEDDEYRRNPLESAYDSYGMSLKKTLDKSFDASIRRREEAKDRTKAGVSKKSTNWKKPVPNTSGSSKSSKEISVGSKDPFSGIHIMNTLVSSTTMSDLMANRKMVQMSSIKNHIRNGEIDGDWVTIGVIVSKSDTKLSQKGTSYSIMQLSDLKDCTKTVSLFLFGEAYKKLWKMTVGSVIGLLNATIMKDSNSNNLATLSLNNYQNVLQMGTCPDLGFCKARTKAGNICQAFVNKRVCECCLYHVQREYQKSCSKRADIQSSFSRVDPRKALQKKVLGKNEVFYGGLSYTSGPIRAPKRTAKKSLLEVSSAQEQMKAKLLKLEEDKKKLDLKHLNEKQRDTIAEVSSGNEQFGNMLLAPSFGALNFLKHKNPEPRKQEITKPFETVSARDFIKMSQQELAKHQAPITSSLDLLCKETPKLGRGLSKNSQIEFHVAAPIIKQSDIKKAKAAAILKSKGGPVIKPSNLMRNKDKMAQESHKQNVKKRLSSQIENDDDEKEKSSKRSKIGDETRTYVSPLGTISLNSEKIREIIAAKSIHSNLVDAIEEEKMETHFNLLEKKEMLENKLTSTMEVPTNAVTCLKCKYTAQSASDICKEENHPLKVIKTVKRFFECRDCKRRTTALQKLPNRPCSNCQSSSWVRVAMAKERKGPVSDSEVLSLRGNEMSHYGGESSKVYLHVDS